MVVYEMLAGRTAFAGSTALALIDQHIHATPFPPSHWNSQAKISQSLEKAVLKALEKDRDLRQPTIRQFADELEVAIRQPVVPAAVPRKKSAIVGIALLVAFLLGNAIYLGNKFRMPGVIPTRATDLKGDSSKTASQYRILRHDEGGTLRLLGPNDSLREGERIHFEFTMPFQGSFYLLYEQRDGSLIWTNPGKDGTPQSGMGGAIMRVPESNAITMGPGEGSQNFLALFVPADLAWSLRKIALPETIQIRLGEYFPDASLRADLAARIRKDLTLRGREIKFPYSRTTESHEALSAGQILFSRVTFSQNSSSASP
jgi:hypothetical protein